MIIISVKSWTLKRTEWEVNKDCNNDNEDNKLPPPLLPAKKLKDKRNSEYSHDNYDPSKPYAYQLDYYDSDKSYEYTPMDISEENRHAAKFSLPRDINPSVDNLCNVAFFDSLLDTIVVQSNAYSLSRTTLFKS